jgi:hypothetical protein
VPAIYPVADNVYPTTIVPEVILDTFITTGVAVILLVVDVNVVPEGTDWLALTVHVLPNIFSVIFAAMYVPGVTPDPEIICPISSSPDTIAVTVSVVPVISP